MVKEVFTILNALFINISDLITLLGLHSFIAAFACLLSPATAGKEEKAEHNERIE
jgi:hypothetical protein